MNTTQTEALKLALEALEDLYAEQNAAPLWKRQEHWQAAMNKAEVAMPVLREALAEQPAQQEPFGYFRYDLRLDAWVQNREGRPGTPFYTSPPASKPWVGLTQQDIDIAFDDTQEGGGFNEFARAIETKLREKNTGETK